MKKNFGAFGARQFSLETLVGGRPGTTIFQNPGGGGGLGGGSHTRTRPGHPPPVTPKYPGAGDLAVVWRPKWHQAIANRPKKMVSAAGGVCLKIAQHTRPGGGSRRLKLPNSSPFLCGSQRELCLLKFAQHMAQRPQGALVASSCPTPLLLQPLPHLFSAQEWGLFKLALGGGGGLHLQFLRKSVTQAH